MPISHLPNRAVRDQARSDVPQPLRPDDLPTLMLEDHPRVSTEIAQRVLEQSPGSSWWLPATGEFVLVTPWRHREELVTIHTLGAFANEDLLVRAAMEHARMSGKRGFVVVDINELRQPAFYHRHHLVQLDEIRTYEHRQPAKAIPGRASPDLQFRQVQASDRDLLEAVITLDHAAFPWFWWNSRQEFDTYLEQRGVEIWAGIRDDAVVSYAGVTMYRRWGHLDRIATWPDLQGQGIGRDTLGFVLSRLVRLGGRRVALSTQRANQRSQSLYEGMGFQHTPIDDYAVYLAAFGDLPTDNQALDERRDRATWDR